SKVRASGCGKGSATLVAFLAVLQIASGVTLEWDPSPDAWVAGYAIHFGPSAGNHPVRVDVGNRTSTTITNLTPGVSYFFVATAYSSDGQESLPSNEVAYTTPGVGALLSDLITVTVRGPGSAATGASINLTNAVANGGTGGAGSFIVGLYLSTDAVITTNDLRLATRTVTSLAVGQTNSAITAATIPVTTTPGAYYIGVIADDQNAVSELNEANNTSAGVALQVLGIPDLNVTSVRGPLVAAPGGTITLTNSVRNLGNGDPGAFLVGFYLSDDAMVTTGDLFLTNRMVSGLASGQTNTASSVVTIPSATPAGTYYLGAIADYGNAVAEANETNNAQASLPIQIAVGPDVAVIAVAGPPAAGTGCSISVTNSVQNLGVNNPGSISVGLYLSSDAVITTNDQRLATRTVSVPSPGQINTATTTVTIPLTTPPGRYHLGAIADYQNAIAESNEWNNALASAPIEIGIGPDLSMVVVLGPEVAGTGGTISLTNTVENLGTSSPGTSPIGLYLSEDEIITTNDLRLATRSVTGPAAGQTNTATTTVTIPLTTPPGTYYLGAIADYEQKITEISEVNNALAGAPIEIVVGPDLAVVAVEGPARAGTGGTLSVTNTVQNVGTGNPGSVTVGLYLSTDAVITPDDLRLTTRSLSGPAPGQTNTAVTAVTIPLATPPGTYYLGAIADYQDKIVEVSKSNNALASAPIEIVVGPDLAAIIAQGPTAAGTGGTIVFTNAVQNVGTGNPGSVTVGFYLSADAIITTNDLRLATRTLSGPAPGQINTATTSVTISLSVSPGTYYLGVIADYQDAVVEASELNNALASVPMQVGIGPDLAMSVLQGPATGVTGGTISLTNSVQNVGTGDPGSVTIAFYLSDDPVITTNDLRLATRTVSGPDPGLSNTAVTSLTIPLATLPGTYYLGAIADYQDKILEVSKANNALASAPIQIGIGPDLAVISVSGPTTAGTGGTISLTNSVQNVGTGNPGSTIVGLYLSTDAVITTNDLRLTTRSVSGPDPGLINTAATTVNIPLSITPGTYYLGAIADYPNTVSEVSEANNALAGAPIEIGIGPDLTVTSVRGPAAATAGVSFSVTNAVQNVGNGTPGTVAVALYLSPDPIITTNDLLLTYRNVSALAPGQTNTATTTVNIPAATASGRYYLGAIADYNDKVAEADESNNAVLGTALELTGAPRETKSVDRTVRLLSLQRAGTATRLQFTAASGNTYAVEGADTLSGGGTWTVLPGLDAIPATNSVIEVLDASAAGSPQRFYRVRVLP
ncbi:MAG TPA: CARDB domain-containing protein, partial [Verrucomicrobiae bacterium]